MYVNIEIVGHVGNVGPLRDTTSGKQVLNFSVATNRKVGDQEETTWFKVTVWEGLAQTMSQYIKTGSRVLVQASRVSAVPYIDRNGHPAASLEITANKVIFLSPRDTGDTEDPWGEPPDTKDIPF